MSFVPPLALSQPGEGDVLCLQLSAAGRLEARAELGTSAYEAGTGWPGSATRGRRRFWWGKVPRESKQLPWSVPAGENAPRGVYVGCWSVVTLPGAVQPRGRTVPAAQKAKKHHQQLREGSAPIPPVTSLPAAPHGAVGARSKVATKCSEGWSVSAK